MNALVEVGWPMVIDVTIKATLLLAAAWIVLAVWRPRNSNVAHRLWALTSVAILCLPLLVHLAPGVSLPQGVYPRTGQREATPELTAPTRATAQLPLPADSAVLRAASAPTGQIPRSTSTDLTNEIAAEAPSAGPISIEPPRALNGQAPWSDWGKAAALVVYLGGVVAGGVRFLWALHQSRQLTRRARPITQPVRSAFAISRATVCESDDVIVPLTVGILRPFVLLPSNWHTWENSLLQAVIQHEGEHVRRQDVAVTALAALNCVIYWFHPAVYRLRRRLADLAEQVCDDAVIAATGNRTDYARNLLDVAALAAASGRRTNVLGVAMARRSQVERRIVAIIDADRPLSRRLGAKAAVFVACVAAPLVLIAAGLRATEAEGQPPKTDPVAGSPDAKPAAKAPVLHGRITDEDGQPVTEAQLTLTGETSRPGGRINYFEARTDGDGRFQFAEPLAADNFRLRITSTGWIGLTNWRALPQIELSPERSVERNFTLKRACRVHVRATDEADQPIRGVRLFAAPVGSKHGGMTDRPATTDGEGWATVGGLEPSDTPYLIATMVDGYAFAKVEATLDDPDVEPRYELRLSKGVEVPGIAICSDGKPPAGWRVTCLPAWWGFGLSPNGQLIAEDGSFTLTRITPGKYNVTVGVPLGDGMTRVEPVLQNVSLPGDGKLELKLRTPSPQSMAAIAGTIKFVGGEPSANVMVDARSDAGENHSAMLRQGDSDFRISPLPPGRYTLKFSAPDIEQKEIRGVAAPSDDLSIELQVTGKPRLAGRATRAGGGEPLTGLRIRVLKMQTLRGPNYVQDPQWRQIDDPQGRFEMDVVGPGVYQVVAVADGLAPTKSAEINTDAYRGEPIVIEVNEGGSITGTVVDESGLPIDGAKIIPQSMSQAIRAPGIDNTVAGEGAVESVEGRFALSQLTPGTEWLKVVHPDYAYAMVRNVTVEIGEKALEPIVLKRGGSVSGTVYDADGQPESGVALKFDDSFTHQREGENVARAVSDGRGRFEVHYLPDERLYVFRAEEWNSMGVVRQAILPVNGEMRTINLGGQNAVRGQLLVNGKPLATAKILLGGESPHFGIFKAYAQTDAEGRFTFWGPSVSRHTLYYLAPNSRHEWIKVRNVTVAPDTTDLGAIDLQTATLTVQVRGLSPDEAAAARVTLTEFDPIWPGYNGSGVPKARASADAPWVIEQVPPGEYELLCQLASGVVLRQRVSIAAGEPQASATMEWPASRATLRGKLDQAAMGGPGVFNPPNLWSKDQRLSAYVTPRDGSYSIEGLPAGDYYLTDKGTRDATPVLEFTLADGETSTLDLTADNWKPQPLAVGMMAVHCYTDEGVPIAGADVTATGPDGPLNPSSSQEGRVTFVGPPGNYKVAATFPGFAVDEHQIEIERFDGSDKARANVTQTFRLKRAN